MCEIPELHPKSPKIRFHKSTGVDFKNRLMSDIDVALRATLKFDGFSTLRPPPGEKIKCENVENLKSPFGRTNV